MDSILDVIKKLLGLDPEDTSFDIDIIVDINMVLMTLHQLGIGPTDGFYITGKSETWGDFIGDSKILEGVKTYIYLKTRIVFDPPTSSAVLEAINRQITELEWRLNSQVDFKPVVDEA